MAAALAGVLALTIGISAPPAAALPTPPRSAWWYTELDLRAAWRISQGAGVTVAVVDSGVKESLGDLRGQVLPGKDYTGESRNGWRDAGPPDNPLFGHGSLMAAMIAGTGRGAGIVGVAPQAKILPVRLSSGPTGDGADVPPAIRWAVDHGAQIVNLSIASPSPCVPALQSAVDYAVQHGVLVVAAAGDGSGPPVQAPANCVGAIAVGGIADSAVFRPWSGENYGPTLDFVAPADRLTGEYLNNRLGAARGEGDSAAAAIVSGTFALLRSRFPQDSIRTLVTRALWAVHNGLGPGSFGTRIDNRLGYGEILPYYALTSRLRPHAANPLWDRVERHLGGGSRQSSSASAGAPPALSTSTEPGSTGGPATAGSTAGSSPSAAVAPVTTSSSGPGAGSIAGIAIAVVVVAGLGLWVALRRRGAAARR